MSAEENSRTWVEGHAEAHVCHGALEIMFKVTRLGVELTLCSSSNATTTAAALFARRLLKDYKHTIRYRTSK